MKKRNVTGLRNASKTDSNIVQKFKSNWEDLAYEARIIEASLQEKEQEQLRKQEEEDVKMKREVRQYQFNMAKVIFLSIMFIGAYILCSGEGSIAIGITCIVGSICILVFFYLYVNKWHS